MFDNFEIDNNQGTSPLKNTYEDRPTLAPTHSSASEDDYYGRADPEVANVAIWIIYALMGLIAFTCITKACYELWTCLIKPTPNNAD
jgi:hypothetical protein